MTPPSMPGTCTTTVAMHENPQCDTNNIVSEKPKTTSKTYHLASPSPETLTAVGKHRQGGHRLLEKKEAESTD